MYASTRVGDSVLSNSRMLTYKIELANVHVDDLTAAEVKVNQVQVKLAWHAPKVDDIVCFVVEVFSSDHVVVNATTTNTSYVG